MKLLGQICKLLLDNNATLYGEHRLLPSRVELALFVFADGYNPRGRPDVTYKVALVDLLGVLWPMNGKLPQHFQAVFVNSGNEMTLQKEPPKRHPQIRHPPK